MASTMRAGSILRSLLVNVSRTCNRTFTINTRFHPALLSSCLTNDYNTKIVLKPTSNIRFNSTQPMEKTGSTNKNAIMTMDRAFARFHEKCQRSERVSEKDFVKTFNFYTKIVESLEKSNQFDDYAKSNVSLASSSLLRCCGKLMYESPAKMRELLAGNLWEFIKAKNIPIDISHYNSLIRVLNENKTNYDPKKILEEMIEANLVPDRITYQRLIHQYCLQGDIGSATSLLEKMKDLGMELNEQIFASLIIGYGKQENPPTLKEIFDLMKSNGVEPGSRSVAAAIVSVTSGKDKTDSREKNIELISNLIASEEIQFGPYELIDICINLGPLRSTPSVSPILEKVIESVTKSLLIRNKVLNSLIAANQYEFASDLFWRAKPSNRAVESGNVGSTYLKCLSIHENVPVEFINQEANKLRELGYNPKPYHITFYAGAECGRVDLVRASINGIAEDQPVKCHFYWPLLARAKTNEDIIKVLKEDLNPKMNQSDLLDTFFQWVWPKFFGDFQKLFDLNKDLGYNPDIIVASFLNYSIQENKMLDAIQTISQLPVDNLPAPQEASDLSDEPSSGMGEKDGRDGDTDVAVNPRLVKDGNNRSNLIARMLEQIADQTKDPQLVQTAFDSCKSPNQKPTVRVLSPLVKVHIMNNDYDKAIEVFIKIANEYKLTPCSNLLMNHCLVQKDPENLQKIMNILSSMNGESNALFDLGTCCLQCGKLKQAQKIFTSPGFRVRPPRVYQVCRYLAKQADTTALEAFVNLTKNMYDIDQEYLYQVLIESYERTSNSAKVLELWNSMQEEEFQPSKKSLAMIARVLEKNKIAVPFQKPRISLQN